MSSKGQTHAEEGQGSRLACPRAPFCKPAHGVVGQHLAAPLEHLGPSAAGRAVRQE